MANLTGFNRVMLSAMLDREGGEDGAKSIFSDFLCPHNMDVQNFLHKKAIEFSKQRISQTHLIFSSHQSRIRLIGYFALSPKAIYLNKKSSKISNTLRKRLVKYSTNNSTHEITIPAPLIAQLGKNFKDSLNDLISGDELLNMALDQIRITQEILGGKIVFLECEHNSKLVDFYRRNGFMCYAERKLDPDEDDVKGSSLFQMIKFL